MHFKPSFNAAFCFIVKALMILIETTDFWINKFEQSRYLISIYRSYIVPTTSFARPFLPITFLKVRVSPSLKRIKKRPWERGCSPTAIYSLVKNSINKIWSSNNIAGSLIRWWIQTIHHFNTVLEKRGFTVGLQIKSWRNKATEKSTAN